ncbi:LIC12162 family transferase [Fluviispira sanaruensis]|uniref:Transferase, LIC12162 family n=1 Tax=Fluviispira sanaruensis TaxID=2493639 RepID=A0A4P2VMA5_FLUSA|nr:LIC12162 family protein [Fluviispira sanaruensis]BBH54081.1 hypothetical protein JCM31447_25380 [Fluviispira sanaruensis]
MNFSVINEVVKKTTLIKTPNDLNENIDQNLLLLGVWCDLYEQKDFWKNKEKNIFKHHNQDKEDLSKNINYLNNIYDLSLNEIRDYLNNTHCVNETKQYWHIVIGPWLRGFIDVFYDRYLSIKRVNSAYSKLKTNIDLYDEFSFTPQNYNDFSILIPQDSYNSFLYAFILNNIIHSIELIETNKKIINYKSSIDKNTNKFKFKFKLINFILNLYSKIIPLFLYKFAFIDFNISKDILKLFFLLKSFPYYEIKNKQELFFSEINKVVRLKLLENRNFNNRSEFLELLLKILPEQIPICYIESYSKYLKYVQKNYPKNPKFIFSIVSQYTNEAFKYWVAESTKKSAKIILHQHGGHYGIGLSNRFLEYEASIAFKFISFGWQDQNFSNILPAPSYKLSHFKREVKYNPYGKILLVPMSIPRYPYHMYSVPIADSYLTYLNQLDEFIIKLTTENKKNLSIRIQPLDNAYGWNLQSRWKDKFPNIEIYSGIKSFSNHVSESRLIITTYNSTTFLELISANYPVIIFWDYNLFEICQDAVQSFNELIEANIFHKTPNEAATFVNEISYNPLEWWHKEKTQSARLKFCEKYARVSDNWTKDWYNLIKSFQ